MTHTAKAVYPETLPPPAGHYAPAVRYGDLIFVSGQLPTGAPTGGDSDFEEQVRRVIGNLLVILDAAGAGASDLLKVTAYIVGIERWAEFNRVYAEMLGDAKPARAIVPVPELHFGYLVEVEAVAVCGA